MAEGILVLKTSPGRVRPGSQALAVGSFEALFLYQLDPPIKDFDGSQVAPTPSDQLVEVIGQPTIDRYLQESEVTAFKTGDGAWEFVAGERVTIRDVEGGPLRLETIPDLIERLKTEWAAQKARSMADWAAEYEFTGKRITP